MYIPEYFKALDRKRVIELIRDYGFGLLVSIDSDRPIGSHIPFLYEENKLLCHLARANPQASQLETGGAVMAVFTGPHAYVSPTWYESAGVPTWNYAVAHVYGHARTITAISDLKQHIERLVSRYERYETPPWQPRYDSSRLGGIVGLEIEITDIQGKFKLSQNRPEVDRRNVIERLTAKSTDNSVGTAKLMQETLANQ